MTDDTNKAISPYKNITGLENINRFEDFITAPGVLERVRAVLPMHLTPERMMRTVALAAYKNPKIRECHPISLLGAVMLCASLGCEPNTPLGHAYLIPFEKKKYNRETRQYELERVDVNVVIGYPGLIDLARRSGNLVSIRAGVVYEGDEFSYEYGSNMHLRHRPKGLTEGRKPTHAYAYAKLTDGEAFEVLPYEEALSFRRYSQAYTQALSGKSEAGDDPKQAWKIKAYNETPWVKHEPQMVAKTMTRRLATWLPKSIEFANALTMDALSDQQKIDFRKLAGMQAEEGRAALESGAPPEIEEMPQGEPAPTERPEPTAEKKPSKPREKKATKEIHGGEPAPDEAGRQARGEMLEEHEDPRPFNPSAYLDEWRALLNDCETVEQCDKLDEDAREKLKVDRTRLSIWKGFYEARVQQLTP